VAPEGAGLRAELRYRLHAAPEEREIPIRVLPLGDVVLTGLTASLGDATAPLALEATSSGLLVDTIPLPNAAGDGEVVHLTFRYHLRSTTPGAGQGTGAASEPGPTRLPLIVVPWAPDEAAPGVFAVRVLLPEGARLDPGFPATWSRDGTGSSGVLYRAELPVLPSFVSFRLVEGVEGGGWRRMLWALGLVLAAVGAGWAFRRARSPG
jgi:hypothetical protein